MDLETDMLRTLTDSVSKEGDRSGIKILTCFRVIGDSVSLLKIDDNSQIGAETIRKYIIMFTKDIKDIERRQVLNRWPTAIQRMYI